MPRGGTRGRSSKSAAPVSASTPVTHQSLAEPGLSYSASRFNSDAAASDVVPTTRSPDSVVELARGGGASAPAHADDCIKAVNRGGTRTCLSSDAWLWVATPGSRWVRWNTGANADIGDLAVATSGSGRHRGTSGQLWLALAPFRWGCGRRPQRYGHGWPKIDRNHWSKSPGLSHSTPPIASNAAAQAIRISLSLIHISEPTRPY